jgi:hypothetical protein
MEQSMAVFAALRFSFKDACNIFFSWANQVTVAAAVFFPICEP